MGSPQWQPHNLMLPMHAAFTHGLSNKWTYLSRTISGIGNLLEPLELIIRMKLIPKLTGQSPPCDNLWHLLSLLARLDGIALTNPMSTAEAEFSGSTKIIDPLKKAVIEQSLELPYVIIEIQMRSRNEVRKLKQDQSKQDAEWLKQSLPTSLQRSMDLAQEKGPSTWLTTLPIRELGFNLHKGAFLDALVLRYNWQPSRTPTTCACGISWPCSVIPQRRVSFNQAQWNLRHNGQSTLRGLQQCLHWAKSPTHQWWTT